MDQHRPILLTSPDGTHSIINQVNNLSLDDQHTPVNKTNEQGEDDEPPSPNTENTPFLDNSEPINPNGTNGTTTVSVTGGVQFDSEQIQRGRSRIKRRSDFVAKNSENESNGGSGNSSRSTSRSFSRSRSRSRSRTASRIRDEEFLKWTVLRQDPSMRLHNYKMKYNQKVKRDVEDEDEDEDEDEEDEYEDESGRNDEDDEDDDDEEDEDEEEDDDEEEEESDEEQVSDIENDTSINEQFNYDLGTKVLPNFCISINEVLESSKIWISKYETEPHDKKDDAINITSLNGGYIRGVLTLSKEGPPKDNIEETATTTPDEPVKENNDSYILYVDLTSESIYAITYVMGTLVKNGDTVYIVHWHSDRKDFVSDVEITKNIVKLRNTVLHLFDCVSATIDHLDVVILSLTHPYPKHLLNEMINGLQPIALCCSLSMTLSGLQNFVCSVPTFIIRKKLKRAKKKGIFD